MIIMDNFTQAEGYYHYKSVEFARSLFFSNYFFYSYITCKCGPLLRPWDPPNTPRSDIEDQWDSDDPLEY